MGSEGASPPAPGYGVEMSALYGWSLVFPVDGLAAGLRALAGVVDPEEGERCTVVLPGGLEVELPCAGAGEDGPVDRVVVGDPGDPEETWLSASLRVPGLGTIGLVTVFVYAGRRFGLVSVGATTTAMSRLWESSGPVRAVVRAVLAEGGGVAAVLSREPGEPGEDLLDPGVPLALPPIRAEDPASIDAFAEVALRAQVR